jgi:hypothetical protein
MDFELVGPLQAIKTIAAGPGVRQTSAEAPIWPRPMAEAKDEDQVPTSGLKNEKAIKATRTVRGLYQE